MKTTVFAAVLYLFVTGAAEARNFRGFGGGFRAPVTVRPGARFGFGFGNVVFPGGLRPLRLGTVRPFHHGRFFSPFASPIAYPVFVGGFGGYYPPPEPSVVVVYAQPPEPQAVAESRPTVVINQYLGEEPRRVTESPRPVIFSIAREDRTVETAVAYWVVGDTLHYITPEGRRAQMPLGQVDRARSEQLNRESGLDFGLPPR
jgi:hypothetical protein